MLAKLSLSGRNVEIDFLRIIEPGKRVLPEGFDARGGRRLDPVLALLSRVQDRAFEDRVAPGSRSGIVGARGAIREAGADDLALFFPRLFEVGPSIHGRLAFERHVAAVAIHGIARPLSQRIVGFLGARGVFQVLDALKAGASLIYAARDLLEPATDASPEVLSGGAGRQALLMDRAVGNAALICRNRNHQPITPTVEIVGKARRKSSRSARRTMVRRPAFLAASCPDLIAA